MIELWTEGTTGPMRIKEAMENMLPAMETTFDNWYLSQICKGKIYEVGQFLIKFHIIKASVGPEPDITLIFTLNLNLISGNQVQGRISKIRLFPDIRVMPDIRVLT